MGETARERLHRMQEEKARTADKMDLTVVGARPPVAAVVRNNADAIRTELHRARKERLAERITKLGVLTTVGELPDAEADLADLERACAEQERAAQ